MPRRSRQRNNFDRVTVMVNNKPLADPDACGRLRLGLIAGLEQALENLVQEFTKRRVE